MAELKGRTPAAKDWAAHADGVLNRIVGGVMDVFDQTISNGFVPSGNSIAAQKRIGAAAAQVRKDGWGDSLAGDPIKKLDQLVDDYEIIIGEYCLYLEAASRQIAENTKRLKRDGTQVTEEIEALMAVTLESQQGRQRKRTAH